MTGKVALRVDTYEGGFGPTIYSIASIRETGTYVEVAPEQLERWQQAEEAYRAAQAEMRELLEAAEEAHLERMLADQPPRDPDAPVRPVRSLFPTVKAARAVLYDGLDRFNVPGSVR